MTADDCKSPQITAKIRLQLAAINAVAAHEELCCMFRIHHGKHLHESWHVHLQFPCHTSRSTGSTGRHGKSGKRDNFANFVLCVGFSIFLNTQWQPWRPWFISCRWSGTKIQLVFFLVSWSSTLPTSPPGVFLLLLEKHLEGWLNWNWATFSHVHLSARKMTHVTHIACFLLPANQLRMLDFCMILVKSVCSL